jgi:succinate dehydrogenase / fumarate reductase flavoprotein subunit
MSLNCNESCRHFREEYQTEDGEAFACDDENYKHVAAWESKGPEFYPPYKELVFENVKIAKEAISSYC